MKAQANALTPRLSALAIKEASSRHPPWLNGRPILAQTSRRHHDNAPPPARGSVTSRSLGSRTFPEPRVHVVEARGREFVMRGGVPPSILLGLGDTVPLFQDPRQDAYHPIEEVSPHVHHIHREQGTRRLSTVDFGTDFGAEMTMRPGPRPFPGPPTPPPVPRDARAPRPRNGSRGRPGPF